MEYILTTKQIDKLMKPYWDYMFDGSKIGKLKMRDGDIWGGVIKTNSDGVDKLLAGHPSYNSEKWYCDGAVFGTNHAIFSLKVREFLGSMTRYINDKFDINVSEIT